MCWKTKRKSQNMSLGKMEEYIPSILCSLNSITHIYLRTESTSLRLFLELKFCLKKHQLVYFAFWSLGLRFPRLSCSVWLFYDLLRVYVFLFYLFRCEGGLCFYSDLKFYRK